MGKSEQLAAYLVNHPTAFKIVRGILGFYTQREISRVYGISRSWVSRFVKRLAELGYVEPGPFRGAVAPTKQLEEAYNHAKAVVKARAELYARGDKARLLSYLSRFGLSEKEG